MGSKKTSSKPTKSNTATRKPKMYVASNKDKTPDLQQSPIGISDKSKKQPDYSKVMPAIHECIRKIKEQAHPVTPWHEKNFTEVLQTMVDANDPVAVVVVSMLEQALESGDSSNAFLLVDNFVRPERSFLHKDVPCPPAFMQRGTLLIDKVNANLEEHTKDPNFWWQPITDPDAKALADLVHRLKERAKIGQGVEFCAITPHVPKPSTSQEGSSEPNS